MDNINDEIITLETHLRELAEQINGSDITPDEYARITAEYTSVKQQISALKIRRFVDGV